MLGEKFSFWDSARVALHNLEFRITIVYFTGGLLLSRILSYPGNVDVNPEFNVLGCFLTGLPRHGNGNNRVMDITRGILVTGMKLPPTDQSRLRKIASPFLEDSGRASTGRVGGTKGLQLRQVSLRFLDNQ